MMERWSEAASSKAGGLMRFQMDDGFAGGWLPWPKRRTNGRSSRRPPPDGRPVRRQELLRSAWRPQGPALRGAAPAGAGVV